MIKSKKTHTVLRCHIFSGVVALCIQFCHIQIIPWSQQAATLAKPSTLQDLARTRFRARQTMRTLAFRSPLVSRLSEWDIFANCQVASVRNLYHVPSHIISYPIRMSCRLSSHFFFASGEEAPRSANPQILQHSSRRSAGDRRLSDFSNRSLNLSILTPVSALLRVPKKSFDIENRRHFSFPVVPSHSRVSGVQGKNSCSTTLELEHCGASA